MQMSLIRFTTLLKRMSAKSAAAAKDKERWPEYHGGNSFATYVERTTSVLRKNAEWLNSQWGDGNNGGNDDGGNDDGGNDDGGNVDYPENPEYNPNGVTCMYVWQDGKQTTYDITKVDSITFEEKEVEGIVVKVKVPTTWTNTIYAFIWGDGVEADEHIAMRQGEWFVFVYKGTELNVLFKQNSGWTGHPNQSEDIYTTESACYILTQKGEDKAAVTQVDCE